jgi:hypothetical protein
MKEGAQLVERFGEGALVGRGLRVAGHVHPVGQHSRRCRVADEAPVYVVEEGHIVAAELGIWRLGLPVQLAVGSGEQPVEAHGHGEDELGHGCLLSWSAWQRDGGRDRCRSAARYGRSQVP